TKEEIRKYSKILNLSTWNKPAFSCLSSRFPYGEEISEFKLKKIGKAESFLHSLGFRQVRVRYHYPIARIEIEKEEIPKILQSNIREKMIKQLKKISLDVFQLIAEAEARIHGYDIDEIHFHEVGAVDSIIDIVSTAIGIKSLGIESYYSSKIPLGSGFVDSSHGKLPVPAPATVEILKGIPVCTGIFDYEVTTPTGAAIIRTLAAKFGGIRCMEIEKVGYGAGSKVKKEIPDVLRVLKGIIKDKYRLKAEDLIVLSA
ncbi:unnamed protein product, partial [marine sediment metagenome]